MDKALLEEGKNPRGVKRMIGGEILDNVDANFDEITFKRGPDYEYMIELKVVPEFKEIVTKQALYHNPIP